MAASDWIGTSGDWSSTANWSDGVPDDNSAVANLGGSNSYTVAIAGPIDGETAESFTIGTLNITDPNAALHIDGTLTVAAEIDISAGSLFLSGTIIGGTIKQTGGTIVFSNIGPDWTGTLDGVTVQGVLDLSGGYAVNIKDGLNVTGADGTGPGTINDTGAGSTINFEGTQTFDNATVNFAGTGFSSYLNAVDDNGAPATLTLGPNVHLVTATSGAIDNATLSGSADATIVNQGTITAETNLRSLSIYDVSFTNQGTIDVGNGETFAVHAADFTNTGTINIGQRSTLEFYTDLVGTQLGKINVKGGFVWIEGTLDNTGHVLAVGTGSALGSVSLYNTITGGAIKDSGSGISYQKGAALDGVTYRGTMAIDEGGVTITHGLKLRNLAGTGPGEFDISGGQVIFQGTQTTNNATIALGVGAISGTIDAEAAPGTASDTLTFGAGLSLLAGPYADIGGDNAKVVNRGSIVTQGGGAFTVDSASFVNQGAIVVAGGETMTVMNRFINNANIEIIQGLLDLRTTASGTGNYQIDAAGTLEFDSAVGTGQIVKFYGAGGTLQIGAADALKAGRIQGFGPGDSIDLANVAFGGSITTRYTGNTVGGTLVVSDGTHTAKLKLIGDFASNAFAAASDGASGTTISYTGPADGDAALHGKLHQFTAAIAVHSAGAEFSAVHVVHGPDDSIQATVLAAPWHH